MALETAATKTDAGYGARKIESVCGAPSQLQEGVHTFMSLAKMYPDLHPAVLAAILGQPATERQALLEAASRAAKQPASPAASQQHTESLTLTPSSDCDDVWEDAVASPQQMVQQQQQAVPAARPVVPMASVVTDGPGELHRLEREAAECHRAWQQSRQLVHWTRYNDCRNRIALLRRHDSRAADDVVGTADSRFCQLQAQREVHERRLVELARRRERLHWSRRYHEQTRAHHAQLAQAQLQDKLRELEQRAEVRRRQHLQRLQQLVSELSAMDQQDVEEKQGGGGRSSSSRKKADSPATVAAKPARADSSVDEFTHVWDDFAHWEKMVSDDDKENEDPVDAPRGASLSPVGTKPSAVGPVGPARLPQVLAANQPDLIPVLPPTPGQHGPWRSTGSLTRSSSSSSFGQRRSPDSGFEERKKWFEEALNSWHAQDEEEFFGTSLYPPTYMRGRTPQDHVLEHSPQWYQSAWMAWQGPTDKIN